MFIFDKGKGQKIKETEELINKTKEADSRVNKVTVYCHSCYAYTYKKYFERRGYNVNIIHDESEEYTYTTISW